MSKLGYTWYPKDWGNSEAVFELTLSERGLYRELIDMAMLNDNQTIINDKVWSRKFGSSVDEIESILITLENLKLIEINNEFIFIPSCEARLNLVRGGRKGGKKSAKNKPNSKPLVKPSLSLNEKNDKPILNQIEKKVKEIEIKDNIKEKKIELLTSQLWIESICMQKKLTEDKVNLYLNTFLDDLELKGGLEKDIIEIKSHFINWLNIQIKEITVKPNYKI
jgi:hypothetical protein